MTKVFEKAWRNGLGVGSAQCHVPCVNTCFNVTSASWTKIRTDHNFKLFEAIERLLREENFDISG